MARLLALVGLVAARAADVAAEAATQEVQLRPTPSDYVMKGFAYGPVPLTERASATVNIPGDDFMGEEAKPLWGSRGRGDLELMQRIGANTIRLYGNDPRHNHGPFLDLAGELGIDVIPGLSDWPYTQMPGNCAAATDFDCYQQVKHAYANNLRNGWLRNGAYHPALQNAIVINEPELKLGSVNQPRLWTRAIVSAIDGMLDAEREANVSGPLINFSVPFSFAVCTTCWQPLGGSKPGLGQMMSLHRAMQHPESVGYVPRNDLAVFYQQRFTNSYNTANPARDIRPLFLDAYESVFPATPVYIGEFHSPHTRSELGLGISEVLDLARSHHLFLGMAFFEWQVRYDKGGSEMDFGMFGLGSYQITQMTFMDGGDYPVWCLTPVMEEGAPASIAAELTSAYEGAGVDFAALCQPHPEKVTFDEAGLRAILALGDAAQTAGFVARAVRQGGGSVVDASAMRAFASGVVGFDAMLAALAGLPAWASWDEHAACVADRDADIAVLGPVLQRACEDWFDCSRVPVPCSGNSWDFADYVFSTYHTAQGTSRWGCHFDSVARLAARAADFAAEDSRCIVSTDAATTALTEEGWAAVRTRGSAAVAAFAGRVVLELLGAEPAPHAQLAAFAATAPANSLHELRQALEPLSWVCGGSTGRVCTEVPADADQADIDDVDTNATESGGSEGEGGSADLPGAEGGSFLNGVRSGEPMWWRPLAFAALGLLVLLAGLVTCCYVVLAKRCRGPRTAGTAAAAATLAPSPTGMAGP